MIKTIKKLRTFINNLLSRLADILPGYITYCEDCGHLKELTYLREVQKFMCRDCEIRYAKLYVKMNGYK